MLLAVGLFGLMTVVFAVSRSVPLSVFALAVLGGADMVSVFTRQSLVQIATPDRMRGRVSAVATLFIGASNELGEFESGVTARFLGPVGAVAFGGAGAMAVTALWSLAVPEPAQGGSPGLRYSRTNRSAARRQAGPLDRFVRLAAPRLDEKPTTSGNCSRGRRVFQRVVRR